MTHQEIAEAFETLYPRAREAAKKERDWLAGERERLQAECAKVGHIVGRDRSMIGYRLRVCLVCGTPAADKQEAE